MTHETKKGNRFGGQMTVRAKPFFFLLYGKYRSADFRISKKSYYKKYNCQSRLSSTAFFLKI